MRRDRAMKPESKPRLQAGHPRIPSVSTTSRGRSRWPATRGSSSTIAWIWPSPRSPRRSTRGSRPGLHPGGGRGSRDQPWAPPVPRDQPFVRIRGETLETRRKFERRRRRFSGRTLDEYEKAWVEDRRARREKVRKQHALAEVIQRVRRQRRRTDLGLPPGPSIREGAEMKTMTFASAGGRAVESPDRERPDRVPAEVRRDALRRDHPPDGRDPVRGVPGAWWWPLPTRRRCSGLRDRAPAGADRQTSLRARSCWTARSRSTRGATSSSTWSTTRSASRS